MKAKTYSDKFFTILSDLMNTSFQTDHVVDLIRESYAQVQEDVKSYYTEEYRQQIESDLEGALNLASSRNETVRADLQTWFGLSGGPLSAGSERKSGQRLLGFHELPRKTTIPAPTIPTFQSLTASVARLALTLRSTEKLLAEKEQTAMIRGRRTGLAPGGKDNSMTGEQINLYRERLEIYTGRDIRREAGSKDPTVPAITGNIQPGIPAPRPPGEGRAPHLSGFPLPEERLDQLYNEGPLIWTSEDTASPTTLRTSEIPPSRREPGAG